MIGSRGERLLSNLVILASTLLGCFSFLYPFFLPNFQQTPSPAGIRLSEMPLTMTLVLGLCVIALLFESQQGASNARMVALMGVLVALNSVLRYIEVAIPGPGGFSPVFFLIILSGYLFGAKFGFLMGAMTLFVSAILTGGVGPWLPSQMFTAGWVGMSAAILSPLVVRLGWQQRRGEIVLLALFGFGWGLLYGAIMNLWSWPFITGPADQYWQPGISFAETIARYGVFYLATSLAWDLGRSLGNVLLIGLFGTATLRVLRRFRERFTFVYQPAEV
ncbi:MAG: ECF transporter S component [Anaerolineales bacterium]|nr:ECF transporter S component [Anaerolineales bacterium]MDW8161341.1 ECF transporter S component [Anaerolineales bacterium]